MGIPCLITYFLCCIKMYDEWWLYCLFTPSSLLILMLQIRARECLGFLFDLSPYAWLHETANFPVPHNSLKKKDKNRRKKKKEKKEKRGKKTTHPQISFNDPHLDIILGSCLCSLKWVALLTALHHMVFKFCFPSGVSTPPLPLLAGMRARISLHVDQFGKMTTSVRILKS